MNRPQRCIEVRDLSFQFSDSRNGDAAHLFERFDLTIEIGSTTAIQGPSGTGKSVLAKILACLIAPQLGTVEICSDQTNVAAKLGDIVYVDQDPWNCVLPWLSVRGNLEWGPRNLGWSNDAIRARAEHLLATFRLAHRQEAYPRQMSGGERQRLGLAVMLSWRPDVVILDESLSQLDRATRDAIAIALNALNLIDKVTVVLITHQTVDVLALATRAVVLGGRPVRIAANIDLPLPFPRDVDANDYREAYLRLSDAQRAAESCSNG